MRDLTVDSGGIELAVRDFGGAGNPVILLHGLGRTLVDWSVIGPLIAEQRRSVAFDIRGHGESADGAWSWQAAIADVDAVAHAMGFDADAVVGHSLGGMLAVMWGEAHPEATGVVNIDGHGRRAEDQYAGLAADDVRRRVAAAGERTNASLRALSGSLPAAMIDGLLAQQRALAAQLGAPESMFVESISRTLRTGSDGQAFLRPSPMSLGAEMLADAEATDMFSIYARTLCPVLVIAGTDPDPGADPDLMSAYRRGLRTDLERVAEKRRNLQVRFIDGGHGFLFQQPQELARTVLGFLDTKRRQVEMP